MFSQQSIVVSDKQRLIKEGLEFLFKIPLENLNDFFKKKDETALFLAKKLIDDSKQKNPILTTGFIEKLYGIFTGFTPTADYLRSDTEVFINLRQENMTPQGIESLLNYVYKSQQFPSSSFLKNTNHLNYRK